jgi:hypothetical protein
MYVTGKAALGRRDIVVAWRGTIQDSEWVKNFDFAKDPAPLIFGGDSRVELHKGFYSLYTSENPDLQFSDASSSVRNQVITKYCYIMLHRDIYYNNFVK